MKKIAIITGGVGSERDASIESAENIRKILSKKYTVSMYDYPHDLGFLTKKYDLYIPIIHGLGGEDGEVTTILHTYKKKYIFSKSKGHQITINKYITNNLAKKFGFTIPETKIITPYSTKENIYENRPLFVKPNRMGSSLRANIANSDEEVMKHCKKIHKEADDNAIVSECIQGSEVSICVSDISGKTEIVQAVKITTNQNFYTAKNKHLGEGVSFTPIPKIQIETIHKPIIDMYEYMNLKDIVRFDFIYAKDRYYFLEINTIPGMSTHSILHNALWYTQYKGLEQFILKLVDKHIGI